VNLRGQAKGKADEPDAAAADEHDEGTRMQASAGGAARRQACASQVARPEVLGPLSALTALSGAALAGELGGLALDSDGYIWVPLDAGARLGAEGAAGAAAPTRPGSPPPSLVIRVDPASGKIDRCIDVGARRPTACAFGGGALDELYVTTRYAAALRACVRVGCGLRVGVGGWRLGLCLEASRLWREAGMERYGEVWRQVGGHPGGATLGS